MSLFSLFTHQRPIDSESRHEGTSCVSGAASQRASSGPILVALTGEALDDELMSVACAMARARGIYEVHIIFAVEVPRAFAVTDDLAEERARAEIAFERVSADASAQDIELVKEYIQSRDTAASLAQLAREGYYSLLVIGLPDAGAAAGLDATVEGVLRGAPCRVWVVREAPVAA